MVGDIDLSPQENNNLIMFPVLTEIVDRYMKIIKVKSASCPKNAIFAHAQSF